MEWQWLKPTSAKHDFMKVCLVGWKTGTTKQLCGKCNSPANFRHKQWKLKLLEFATLPYIFAADSSG